jgi:hypothetical protein
LTTRKSPVKHVVHTHARKGKRVNAYTRGSGAAPTKRSVIGPKLIHTTNNTYLYSDIDRDGVINIDDAEPYNPGVTLQANDKEVGLGDELQKIEAERKPYLAVAEAVKRKLEPTHETITYRIKTRNSIINKLRRKHLAEIQDIAGVRILVNTEAERDRVSAYVKRKWPSRDIISEDHHRNKDGFYTADHYTVMEKGRPVEVQVVTHEVAALALQKHKEYKTGKPAKA